ncbi:hypothetical protein IMZ48_17210 [Candidatus Bathyarchaeota archaeon]|nr:hypothetical protein [Candidatus Bathyarchaeota archaeon]
MLVALLVWSTGLWIMWYKAYCRLPLQDEPEVPRGWRAVQELSRAMEWELVPKGINLSQVTDRKAKREIRRRLRGGAVSLDALLARPDYRFWPAFRSWAWRDKWWLVAFCSFLTLFLTRLFVDQGPDSPGSLYSLTPIFMTLTIAVVFVVLIGTTDGSRVFILAFVCLAVVFIPVGYK